jgi:NAD-dependent DNA ligase
MAATTTSVRYNEKFIDLMEQLASIMMKQGEPFRARAYQKAQETIMAFPDDITSVDQLKGKPGIGETILEKLNEYVSTGTLKVLEREKNNPVNVLAEIYGVGPKKAKELVAAGITSIEELRKVQDKNLNAIQKVGLKYYEDILKRIPRSEVQDYELIFQKAFSNVSGSNNVKTFPVASQKASFEIVGSYRRGANSSGDIDVIITSEDPKIFIQFIDLLIQEGVIVEVLSRGPTKCLVIAKIPASDIYRRVDFLYTNGEEYPFSVLYFTGSKIFNTVMRHQALALGFTMNEHGLYKMEDKKKGTKVDHKFASEKDIFDYLYMEYKTPIERIDGRSVIIKKPNVVLEKEAAAPIKKTRKNAAAAVATKKTKKIPKTVKKNLTKRKTPLLEQEMEKVSEKVAVAAPASNNALNNASNNALKKKVEKKKIKKVEVDAVNEFIVDPFIMCVANDFKKNGISVLKKLGEKQLAMILREANKAYYNSSPIMTDNEFDILKEYIAALYPENEALIEVGAPIATAERNKVKLPYEMASMDKIKPDTNALASWTAKYTGPYVLSCKLDGVSGLYTTEGSSPKLYTRGDGKVGQDVSHLIPYLRLPKKKNIVIRGEFIVSKKVFLEKYQVEFANSRNMVAGIINHKTVKPNVVKDVSFVAYEVIKPELKPSEQMKFLEGLDVECVLNKTIGVGGLTNELLSSLLVDWRTNYVYEIDGVIVTDDKIYKRKSGNPEHAFAFKMVLSDQIAEAKVVDVIWNPSKDGYLKPRVQIEPVVLGGVRIEYATGFNGAFIQDQKIGLGAVIELIRSGDVIPYIRKVIVPAESPKMPSVPYQWNNTHIDVMLEQEHMASDLTVLEKNITGFFRGIGVEGLSSGNVARIIQAGYKSVPAILAMKKEDFLNIEGFQTKMATKLYEGIREKVEAASLVTLMSASNLFGRGFSEKKIELIMEGVPDILVSKESAGEKIKKVASIKGMATKSAEAFVAKIPDFVKFLGIAGLQNKLLNNVTNANLEVVAASSDHPLFGKSIVITGFRDKALQESLKKVGAKLASGVSKNTYIVVVKDSDVEETGKVSEAKKLGVKVMTLAEFIPLLDPLLRKVEQK